MTDSYREIERLVFAYAEAIDAGNFESVADLLAGAVVKGSGTVLADRNRSAVLELYTRTTRRHEDGTPRTKHVVTNLVIDVDENDGVATARSYFTVLQALADFPLQPIIAGCYRDRFKRDEQGRWRFDEREIIVDLRGDLSRHLLIDLPG